MNYIFLKYTGIQIIALAFLIIAGIDYFKKKKIWTAENYIYSLLYLIQLEALVSSICILWCSYIYPNETMVTIFNKVYLCFLTGVIAVLVYYIFMLTSKKNCGYVSLVENANIRHWFVACLVTLFIAILVCCLSIFLPGYYVDKSVNGLNYYTGPSAYVVFAFFGIGLLTMICFMIYGRKRVNKAIYVPFIIFVSLGTIGGITQIFVPDFLIVDFICAFTVIYFNFTVENPDLNLIENLNIAKQSAEKATKAKSDFLSNMSHEIRTPLNAIVGFSHALSEENLPDEIQDEVNYIIESSNSLLSVINNILDISKMDAGGVVITPVDYNTKGLVNGLISYSEETCKKKGITFVKNIDPELPKVLYGDNVRIKQIVQNLLSNAVKFTNEGTVTLTIKAVPLKKNCKLFISVSDTGVGITEADVDKIYNQFNKLNNDLTTNYAVGTGLGLTISKRLIEMMDGTIDFESTAGKGSKFLICFEQTISDKEIEAVETYVEDELKFFDAKDKKILIIDDNTVNLKVAKKLFKDYNNEPELSKDVKECIEKIKKGEKYDIIFIDDMMPVMTGTEAIAVLRNIPKFNIPTVVLTANQTSGIREKYIKNGFDDYLAKPLVKSELCYILNKFLNSEANVKTTQNLRKD